ncbi:putative transcription factor WD40-like family [Rosa chinensis]|uniref:Putative transcription factor WD40-like family n=1 Tax=Rosa chinensis TaxID=74649 RepID=A0A2P6QS36_ROSCH|nr:putative transcription factor WD40-like family [Rosa chinensis]
MLLQLLVTFTHSTRGAVTALSFSTVPYSTSTLSTVGYVQVYFTSITLGGLYDGLSVFVLCLVSWHFPNTKTEAGASTLKPKRKTQAPPYLKDFVPKWAASSGVITIWNLKKRRLQSVIKEAHDGSILPLHFLMNEPVLMSSSSNNSIKMWIFDTSDGYARLLRFRSGHSAPPQCIRFYANGRHILSAGQDRAFRVFSIIQRAFLTSYNKTSKETQGEVQLLEEEIKLKPVIAFDCAEIRELDWCNVVSCHMDTAQAYVWRLQNFVLGEHILKPRPENPTPVKACAISSCGNFAILGTAGGWI